MSVRRRGQDMSPDSLAAMAQRIGERFIPEPTSGCWLWTAGCGSMGYGTICSRQQMFLAHRVSYALHKGPIPDGLVVCHRCDVPLCINPDHLFVGTMQDNVQDALRKGRLDTASGHAAAIAASSRVRRARTQCKQGHTYSEVGFVSRPDGARACRRCMLENCRRTRARRKAARQAQQGVAR